MSTIPLVATTIQPPPNSLDQYSKVVQLRALANQQSLEQQLAPLKLAEAQNSVQQGQQDTQLRQIQIQDAQAGMKAMQQWDGKDFTQIPDLIQKNGGSLNAVLGAKKNILDQQTAVMNYNKAQLDQASTKNNYLLGKLQAATDPSIPDEQLPQSVLGAAQQAVQDGYLDPQHAQQIQQMVQQGASNPKALRDQIGLFEKSLMGQQEQFNQAAKQKELANSKEAADAAMLRAKNTSPSEAGLALRSSQGDQGATAALQTLNQNDATRAAQEAQARIPAEVSGEVQKAKALNDAGLSGLTPEALDQSAQRYIQTGVLPAMGMGSAGAAARKAIMNRAGELSPTGSIAQNSAEYAANENSLKNLQKNFDQVNAFENTAGKNLDLFLQTAKGVVDSGSPLINMPLRLVTDKLAGSQNMAAYNAARTTALTEIAKVLNSSNASGVLSDSARSEVSSLVGKDATLGQIYKAAGILKQDMGNRHDAYQEQISDIQTRLGKTGGQPPSTQNVGQPAKSSAQPPNTAHQVFNRADGKLHWTNAQGTADLGVAQ